jgi:hypothetical protein
MKRDNRKGRQTPEQLRSAANDAIAFLHSMVQLVDAELLWRVPQGDVGGRRQAHRPEAEEARQHCH